MSALARLSLQKGDFVQGSDESSTLLTKQLEKEGATIFAGHSEKSIQEGLTVVYSSAIKQENPEWKRALELKLKIRHRSEFLQDLMNGYQALFVTGTHGKTTTTALLASVLMEANLDPSFVIGGLLRSTKTNAGFGKGSYFIAEADESDGSFLKGSPYGAILTNLEAEHLDYWKNFSALEKAFQEFCKKVQRKDLLFWCKDDPGLKKISPDGISYGFDPEADLRCLRFHQQGFQLVFDALLSGKKYSDIQVNLIGKYNILNALAVFGLCLKLNISESVIRKAFVEFCGTARRMEPVGELKGSYFYDEYAHHPTEISLTLKALRAAIFPKRLVAVFQPHRFTRVRDLGDAFPSAFEAADLLIVTDIYSAGEEPISGVDTPNFLRKILKVKPALYIPKASLKEGIFNHIRPGDTVVTLGAGDITYVGREMCSKK